MTKEAKLYFLFYKDWKPLAESFEKNQDRSLKDDISIFQQPYDYGKNQWYAILSLSEKADEIIKEYGTTEADEKDLSRNILQKDKGETLYGDKGNLSFLKKID